MNNRKSKKSSGRIMLELVFSAILFGAIVATIVVLITVGRREDGKDKKPIIPEIATENDAKPTLPEKIPDEEENVTPGALVDVTALIEACEPAIVAVNTYVPYGRNEEAFNEELGLYFVDSETGVIIGQNNDSLMIVSSYANVRNISNITVTFFDGCEVEASVKAHSLNEDLAIICVDFDKLESSTMHAIKVATMGSSGKETPGQMVVSIGFHKDYGQSVSVGYVNSTDYVPQGMDKKMFRTDIRSDIGGAVVNTKGELIGLSMIRINDSCVLEKGLVLQLDEVKELMLDMVQKEEVLEDLSENTDNE
mgnify:CR=1 FL=1